MDATPQPKEVVVVPGLHIGLDQPERITSTIEIFKNWLVSKDALNK